MPHYGIYVHVCESELTVPNQTCTHMRQCGGMHALDMYDLTLCIVGTCMYVDTCGWVCMHVCIYMHARTSSFLFMCV